MFLEDPFYTLIKERTWQATNKWFLAHNDVLHQFEASLYHFGRMRRENFIGNLKVVYFEYDALIWSLYSVREHLVQELNSFFVLGFQENDTRICEKVKNALQNQPQVVTTNIAKNFIELTDSKWLQILADRRHLITHKVSPPEVIGGSPSLSWGNEPPKVMLNLESIKIFGEKGIERQCTGLIWIG